MYFGKMDKFEIIVNCASGVEAVTKKELSRLGYGESPAINGKLSVFGTATDVARLNINLRTAERVYIKINEFKAETFDNLFDGVYSIDWKSILPLDSEIYVDGKCTKSKLFAESACQSIVKKAIVEKLKKQYNSTNISESGIRYGIEFYIYEDTASILLNTSGLPLHKRGYRDLVGIAPIKETLASAILLLSDFYWKRPFIDPFCGSGTFITEGARIALNIASGIDRKFAFNNWNNFDKSAYNLAVMEARDNEKRDRQLEFFGSDINGRAVSIATRHAKKAGVFDKVRLKVGAVKDLKSSFSEGTIVTNPPYGERVFDLETARQCASDLGSSYKNLGNWSAFIITADKEFERFFGKRADKTRKLYNSNRECRLYYYYPNNKK